MSRRRLGPVERLPLEPLLKRTPGSSIGTKFENLGYTRHGPNGYRYGLGLSLETADELACRLGLHPMDIWGEAWLAAGRARDANRAFEALREHA